MPSCASRLPVILPAAAAVSVVAVEAEGVVLEVEEVAAAEAGLAAVETSAAGAATVAAAILADDLLACLGQVGKAGPDFGQARGAPANFGPEAQVSFVQAALTAAFALVQAGPESFALLLAKGCKISSTCLGPEARVKCVPVGPAAEQQDAARRRSFWKIILADFGLKVAAASCDLGKVVAASYVLAAAYGPAKEEAANCDLERARDQGRGAQANKAARANGPAIIPIAFPIAISGKTIARIVATR